MYKPLPVIPPNMVIILRLVALAAALAKWQHILEIITWAKLAGNMNGKTTLSIFNVAKWRCEHFFLYNKKHYLKSCVICQLWAPLRVEQTHVQLETLRNGETSIYLIVWVLEYKILKYFKFSNILCMCRYIVGLP